MQGPTPYQDTCSPPTPQLSLTGCTFCPGSPDIPQSCTLTGSNGAVRVGGCAQLEPVYLRPAGCNCGSVGAACGPNGSCCPAPGGLPATCSTTTQTCVACTQFSAAGSACDPSVGCCTPFGSPPLTCGDGICVPATSL